MAFDPLLKGLTIQHQQEIDLAIVDNLRNFLFGNGSGTGLDLASLNIQRGGDLAATTDPDLAPLMKLDNLFWVAP